MFMIYTYCKVWFTERNEMIRVFPRKTNKTPVDDKVYFSGPPLWSLDDREVAVSCLFTYDRDKAKSLADQWDAQGYDVSIGGPAFDDFGGEFVAGRFVRQGSTITSRGCNNKCWFCSVWKREGGVRELEIQDGFDVLDSNLLQCSDAHIKDVFAMLSRQKDRPVFTGGLEAEMLKSWHVELLKKAKASRMYFAYDTEDDYEPLVKAGKMLFSGGFKAHDRKCLCYCLIGYPKDTFNKAEARLKQIMDIGMTPYAMLYQNEQGEVDIEWRKLQRQWVRPSIIYSKNSPYRV